jgi:hypothetical protein
MSNPNPNLKNLTPFKRGHKNLGAGAKKGSKHFTTILKEMLRAEPCKFLMLNDKGKAKIATLKKKGVRSMKELILYQQLQKASKGDQRSTELIIKQSGEDAGEKITVIQNDIDFKSLSDEQLFAIATAKSDGDVGIQKEKEDSEQDQM